MKVLLIGFGKINKLVYEILGEDVVGIVDIYKENINSKPDVIIDFSHPEFLEKTIKYSMHYNIPVLIGTTNYNKEKMAQISELSNFVPVIKSDNFSLGIYLIECFLKDNVNYLKDYSQMLIESHHISKKDSPSGTSLAIKNIIKDVKIESQRTLDNRCVHEVIFSKENEEITLIHTIKNRNEFALMAIDICKWLINKEKGLYTFEDYIKRV